MPQNAEGETLYPVTAFMTQAEYEVRRQQPAWDGDVRLTARAAYTGVPFGETDIPRIIWDAAAAASLVTNCPTQRDQFLRRCDAGQWPFLMKQTILAAAEILWHPSDRPGESGWRRGSNSANQLFDDHPELRKALTEPPEEAAQLWLEKQTEAET